jgi:hypothetical protein
MIAGILNASAHHCIGLRPFTSDKDECITGLLKAEWKMGAFVDEMAPRFFVVAQHAHGE